ncbi:hypothetical protein [Mesorhizobium sp. RMAD-H1]|uniref:hypothetical protein n=1 Tax=Mesorhizobium sp. RMAD-H1 TaxID=2587065 RepID=UPI00160FDDC1|nr:hypothetical protein [Mesorhizobium sp. RMAD-H1]MBB2974221.1 hypothetical protein [Mesorhizobium sp. RMAD-H1]
MMQAFKTVLLLALGAAILYGMQHATPGYGDITSPIVIEGEAGKRVDGSAYAFGLANVHVARSVKTESFGRTREYTTSGVWLILEGAAVAKKESLALTSAEWLGPSGIRYAMSQRLSIASGLLNTERLQPGLPKPVLLAFEVPEKEIAGGQLLIARSRIIPLDEEFRIDPGKALPVSASPSLTILRGNGTNSWTIRAE